MKNIILGKCPKCTKGNIFRSSGNIFLLRAPIMHEYCPECNHKFEKEPGYFVGAMYISYALAVLEMLLLFACIFSFLSSTGILVVLATGLILFSLFNFRYSRIIWIWIFQQ